MSTVIDDHGHAADHAHGPAKGLMRWAGVVLPLLLRLRAQR